MTFDKIFVYLGIVATAAYTALIMNPLGVVMFVGFVLLRVTQQFSEAYSNATTQERLDEAEKLVKDSNKMTDNVQENIDHKLKNFDRELDDRINYFVRGANQILANVNAVTTGLGYGENLKKVEKSMVKKKGDE